MSTTPHPVSPLRQRMLDDMRMRKLGERTQEAYVCPSGRPYFEHCETQTVQFLPPP